MDIPRTTTRVLLLSLALTGAAGAAQAAGAGPRGMTQREPVTLQFRYEADDLQTEQGARRVYRRLVEAARRECTFVGTPLNVLRREDERCMIELIDKAVVKTGSMQLAAVHRGAQPVGVAARR